MTKATKRQVEQLRLRAVNDVTRNIAKSGIMLSWTQADAVGNDCMQWMSDRLDLRNETNDDGFSFIPRNA
jgi:hypothetical protein